MRQFGTVWYTWFVGYVGRYIARVCLMLYCLGLYMCVHRPRMHLHAGCITCLDWTFGQCILSMSGEATARQQVKFADMIKKNYLPSIAGDVWSQSGVSLFGMLAYYYADGCIQEELLEALPLGDISHTGVNLGTKSKEVLAKYNIGTFSANEESGEVTDTVAAHVQNAVCDNASNMLLAWCDMELVECSAHTMQLTVKVGLETPGIGMRADMCAESVDSLDLLCSRKRHCR